MADSELSALTEDTAPADTDWFYKVDSAGTVDRKVAYSNLTPAASETVAGKVERATQAEVDARTDTTRYISPATLDATLLAPGNGKGTTVDLVGVAGEFSFDIDAADLQEFTTSGTWTKPADVSANSVTMCFLIPGTCAAPTTATTGLPGALLIF